MKMKFADRYWIVDDGKDLEIVKASDYDALLVERDQLLEALENLENDNGAIPDHAWMMVKAAIAKCLGDV